MIKCKDIILNGKTKEYRQSIYEMVEDFEKIELDTSIEKPKVGIVGGNWWYIGLTLIVAVTTYFALNKASNNQQAGGNDMAKQTKMMTNIFTIMIIVMSVFMSSALNIYWIVSNGCTLLQNYIVKRSMK